MKKLLMALLIIPTLAQAQDASLIMGAAAGALVGAATRTEGNTVFISPNAMMPTQSYSPEYHYTFPSVRIQPMLRPLNMSVIRPIPMQVYIPPRIAPYPVQSQQQPQNMNIQQQPQDSPYFDYKPGQP